MQNIPFEAIGATLKMIWESRPEARPQFHFFCAGNYAMFRISLMEYLEYVEPERKTPSAVLVIVIGYEGGPYYVFWKEKDEDILNEKKEEWLKKFGRVSFEEVVNMSVGII